MKSLILYGYEFDVKDLLSTVGVVLTAVVALTAVFLNHYFSTRRLRIELIEQDKQRELDRLCRLQEERVNSRMQKMVRLFEYNLELKSIIDHLHNGINQVDDISSAFYFSERLSDFANSIQEIDNKIRVILSVYFFDESLDIDILFLSKYSVELINQSNELGSLKFEEFTSPDEASTSLYSKKSNFDLELSSFEGSIWSLEREFVNKIESEHDKLYNKKFMNNS